VKIVYAIAILVVVAAFGILGGCSGSSPEGPDAGDNEDCELRTSACLNKCYQADLGAGCTMCCRRNGLSCRMGTGYKFYKCHED
jgi:hypothetical protein